MYIWKQDQGNNITPCISLTLTGLRTEGITERNEQSEGFENEGNILSIVAPLGRSVVIGWLVCIFQVKGDKGDPGDKVSKNHQF